MIALGTPFNVSRLIKAIPESDLRATSMREGLPGYWRFLGSVNLYYGGVFINFDPADIQHGYCTAVRVTDLGSACGFDGAILIEKLSVCFLDDIEKIGRAMDCYGWIDGRETVFETAILYAIEGMIGYGYYDGPESFYDSDSMEIVQTESDSPMSFDGWTAEKRVAAEKLRDYVINNFID